MVLTQATFNTAGDFWRGARAAQGAFGVPQMPAGKQTAAQQKGGKQQAGDKQGVADINRAPIFPPQSVLDVYRTEHQKRHDQQQPEHQVPKEHA